MRVVDTTHVLAGPFASYQMAVLGAEVIKVESPSDPDQARMQGSDRTLNDIGMGTAFMAQASNKKTLALDLTTAGGLEAMKRLISTADVFVENYRPGAFDELGLGYDELSRLNPKLIYCSISAFGSNGPRREQTAYDNVIQAFSGMMAMTGHGDGRPLKSGAPVVDYATGTSAAYAIATALFQRERNGGKGQFIDVSMLDVALILTSSHLTGLLWNGKHPEQKGNTFPFATIGCYQASDAQLMIGASNLVQQRRLWTALGREDMIKTDNNQRLDAHAEEAGVLRKIIGTMSADYWETFLQTRRIPAARIRRLEEAIADEQVAYRQVLQEHAPSGSVVDGLTVPVAAFNMSDSPAQITLAPQPVGAQTAEILAELGYDNEQIRALRAAGVVN
ncbi:CoA transferase [Pseudomonas fluorescens]|uniref:CoA transferase n=1 Tax=Pseudomonas fluorescens TaxID=294 RepID=A0A944DNB5_PSEFL|nr:CoA transferase [Pseudomonas fluorescens]MBT2308988.1 CoA transferase [Pseudomonas fluorescens]MBT2312259.1 CoA transferase [Pseudomonas fluorescens]MBT2318174.1 CoA transferase [Pseudomonas fluorescens]MBT2332009.1 CoA transferase [Pseudomonas fluorescens]